MNRKLLKPNLKEIGKQAKKEVSHKPPPPYKTHAENYYYVKQINHRMPLIFHLLSGEVIKGRLEWYDEKCIKVKNHSGTSLIIFKHCLKFIQKDPDYIADENGEQLEKDSES